jgi:predicted DNA binding CopG/RHH family protein
MVYVRRLRWDAWNIGHIARHEVTPDEIEQMCRGETLTSETYRDRLRLIGPVDAGRMLTVILAPDGNGVYLRRYCSAGQPERATKIHRRDARSRMTTRKSRTIPEFKTIQEEAEFWDKHDTADFEDSFKPARVKFAKNLSQGITVRLDPETLDELRSLASEKGIGPTTLARMWILEQLRREEVAGRRQR